MRNWWTTVGAVALCAAAAPSAWGATTPARHPAPKSSLRGHQAVDEGAKPSRGKKPTTKKELAAEKACAAAKTKAAKAKFCPKVAAEEKPTKKQLAAEKACAGAKTRAAKAKLCPKVEADEKPSRASGKRAAAEAVVTTGTMPDARGKVSEITPAPEKVGKGDTLHAISRRTGVPINELIELNKLKKPYHVRVGATVKLPKTRAYVVHPGDTLSGVAIRFGLDTDVLAAFNSFGTSAPIRAGQKIELPPNAEDHAAKIKPAPPKPAARPTPPPARPRPAVTYPPVVREPAPERKADEAPAPEPQAPPPQTTTPPPAAPPYRPPAQTGEYPGATALPPVRGQTPAPQTTAPQTTPPKPVPNVATPQNIAPAPRPAQTHPDRAKPEAPTYPPIRQERPVANPPEESSGFQMIPAPSQTQPNARPTYGQRPTPQTTPPPAQAYRPPATAGRPAIIQTNPAPTQGQVAQAGRGRFIWPVRGNVLSAYGLKANGQKNDGLNITVSTGEPVRAAAAGEVVYAGDQVPSFGNLVLIKHSGGWVTAYAHLGRIAVSNRDQVTQGQQIGVGGQTGSVDQPQLHFEVRYAASPQDKALPVDPALVLPER